MRTAVDLEQVTEVATAAMPAHGTVAAVRHINGGAVLRITGHTNRGRALEALHRAGHFEAVCDDQHGILHVPPRKEVA